MYIEQIDNILIKDSTFLNNYSKKQGNNLYVKNGIRFEIFDSRFSNFKFNLNN